MGTVSTAPTRAPGRLTAGAQEPVLASLHGSGGGGRGPTTKEPWAPPAGELRLPVTQVPHLALQAVPEILSRH